MRKRSRIIAIGAVMAVGSLVAATFAISAKADPDVRWVDNNGRLVETFAKPGNPACNIEVAVDLHRGYLSGTGTGQSAYRSGVVRVSRIGANTLRAQLDLIRVGAVLGGPDVDDRRPSKLYDDRDNGLTPAVPLNSDASFPGNVTNMTGYSDALLNVDADDNVAGMQAENFQVRGSGSVRCTNGTLFSWTKLSTATSNDAA